MEAGMNDIHSTVIIRGDVKLGRNNKILPYTILEGPLEIGDDNIIGPHVVIGSPGADTKNPRYDSSRSRIRIGNRNIIREFSAIQKACYKDVTILEDDIFLMQAANISHDVLMESQVVVTANCSLAGIVKLLRGANLGMGATISQHCVVGQYSIVATGAAATKNVRPFTRYIPGQAVSVNDYALKKFGFEAFREEIANYVLRRTPPTSKEISAVVAHYAKFHAESERKEY
jgi:UDP-N-acetylglucosamine acyltransferase